MRKILVLGLGKVGSLVAEMLSDSGFEVTAMDSHPPKKPPFKIIKGNMEDKKLVSGAIRKAEAVVSCLPYHLNIEIAKEAHKTGVHYFDLTEDVEATETIRKLAKTAKGVMVPQCGLAPGFIGIVGAHLAQKFDKLRSIELRVGALPQNPKGLLGYAFNWSPEGVVNEYLNDCQVIQEGRIKTFPAMQALETIVIKGMKLEAFTTSGGLGTMCETYDGKVTKLNYKTMRYPGHCKLMRFFFHEILMKEDREKAGEILVNAKPPVDDDVVYVHAAVEGWKKKALERDEYVRAYYPMNIGCNRWRAISWTTSASIVAVIEMVANKTLPQKGFIKQEDIPLDKFLKTKTGSFYNKKSAQCNDG